MALAAKRDLFETLFFYNYKDKKEYIFLNKIHFKLYKIFLKFFFNRFDNI